MSKLCIYSNILHQKIDHSLHFRGSFSSVLRGRRRSSLAAVFSARWAAASRTMTARSRCLTNKTLDEILLKFTYFLNNLATIILPAFALSNVAIVFLSYDDSLKNNVKRSCADE